MLSHPCVVKRLVQIEQFLNPFDWVPKISVFCALSTFSGAARILIGSIEVVAGIAFALLRVMQSLLDGKMATFRQTKQGICYSLHGCANIGRGLIAMSPVNPILLLYDTYVGRLNYTYEIVKEGIYPIVRGYEIGSSRRMLAQRQAAKI
ncbi:MAG: hypothetical protein V4487_04910 [Chlamydiota bacterium]